MGSVRASFLKRKPTQVAVMDLAIFWLCTSLTTTTSNLGPQTTTGQRSHLKRKPMWAQREQARELIDTALTPLSPSL
jgi:hypothetical protein